MTNKISENWYEDFFQGINCEMLEKAYSADWTNQEVEFLISELNVRQGQHMLDIPCGFGRHSIGLAKRGLHVTGIDISPAFINGLTDRIKSGNLNIEAIRADILSMQL